MYQPERYERLQQIINKYKKKTKTSLSEKTITRGGFTTKTSSYVEQPDGAVIHVIEEQPDSYVGPGYYNPLITETSNVKYTIPKGPRPGVVAKNENPGPAKYTKEPSSTRVPHKLFPSKPYPLDPTPISGDLTHPDWIPKAPTTFPSGRYPKAVFKDDLITSEFSSQTTREIFNEVHYGPSPTKYDTITEPIGGVEKSDETDPIFKSRTERFPDDKRNIPAPDSYTIPDEFGKANTKQFKPPNEKIAVLSRLLKEQKFTPDQIQYQPEIINKPNTKHKSAFFASKVPRDIPDREIKPPVGAYDINRDSKIPQVDIRPRVKMNGREWDEIPQKSNPSCADYNVPPPKPNKGGYISKLGHNAYGAPKPDRPLAFRTQHSSFIQKSYNARYKNVGLTNY